MASKLDLALDEVIKERRNENKSKRGGSNKAQFGTRRREGGNIRKRNDGGGSATARSFVRSVQVPTRRGAGGRDRRNVNGQWSHDKFVDDVGPSSSINSRLGGRPSSSGVSVVSTELSVENLHYDVTEQDLKELFSTVGDVQKARIKFDLSGRSTGSAFIKYVNADDAREAAKKYDGVLLDGQAMRIEIKEREHNEGRGNRGGRNNFRNGNNNRQRNNNNNNNSGNRSSRDRNNDRGNKTAEDLDREMESYMTNNDSNDMMVD